MSVEDIARVTKIPIRSLQCLESGTFDKLPADVFVRGFVRSYVACVGLDPANALRLYGVCRNQSDEELAPVVAAGRKVKSEARQTKPARPQGASQSNSRFAIRQLWQNRSVKAKRKVAEKSVDSDVSGSTWKAKANDPDAQAVARKRSRDDSLRMFLPTELFDAEDGSRRGALTVAVIILVIVATLTMSYLLRRPTNSGDGVALAVSADSPSLVVGGLVRSGLARSGLVRSGLVRSGLAVADNFDSRATGRQD